MAVVEYKCDVCKRTIGLQRNVDGLETVGRCTITHGCRGTLYQINLYPDYTRGSLPDGVTGLDAWQQRKVLYNHTQPIEKQEWTVEHNMGTFPSISVFVDRPIQDNPDNREEITPTDVIIVDDNTIKLTFDRPWSGIAQLIARQTDPDLFRTTARAAEPVAEPIQISSGGEITLATKASEYVSVNINVNVRYDVSSNEFVDVTYTVDDQPSINSPWVDFNKATIGGKIYDIRSFDALVSQMSSGVINSGSTFRFIDIDGSDIEKDQVYILLAADPYETVDKQRDRFIDITSVTSDMNQFALFYDSGEFFVDPSIIQRTFPPIRPVLP